MKTYLGRRCEGEVIVLVVDSAKLGTRGRRLNPRHDVANHSPNGFEWGYLGSGPAQLALALCCDVLGGAQLARAVRVHQLVKDRLVATIEGDEWKMTEDTVLDAINDIEHELAHADHHEDDD